MHNQQIEKLMTWTARTEGWTSSVQKVKMHICNRVITLSHFIIQPRIPNLICAQGCHGGTSYILVKDFTNGTDEGQPLLSKKNYLVYLVFYKIKNSAYTF